MVAIEGITASTEMMVRMVNALAELARLEDPDDRLMLEVIDAEEVVGEAIEHVAMEAKLRESTITSESEHGLTMRGDRRRLILALTNLLGNAGPYPDVMTVGLRNLAGVVNAKDGTVTLWATTSTSSTSGDNGADPNKVVRITDDLAATSAAAVSQESFKTVVGPTYGTVYRGVAHVD